MPHISKRFTVIIAKVDRDKAYPVAEALQLVKETATAKFDESVDVAINLGVDAKKSDQMVRGSVVLPAGTGKTVRIAVFAQGQKATDAKAAGADIVGLEDLAEQIKAGKIEFDVAIAAPDCMRVVGQLGQILGPRGLMPNPKVGTVPADGRAVKNAKAGCPVPHRQGWHRAMHDRPRLLQRRCFEGEPAGPGGGHQLPPSSKDLLKKISASSTMGIGVRGPGTLREDRREQLIAPAIEIWAA